MSLAKGQAFTTIIPMYDDTVPSNLKTGLTLLCEISTDGGSFIPVISVPAEIGTSGVYTLLLTATEMDGDIITLKTTATGACDQAVPLITDDLDAMKIDTAAVKIVTDILANMYEDDGAVRRWTANALEQAPRASGFGIASGTVTVKDEDNSLVADAQVWITSDISGSTLVAGPMITPSNGRVTFYLDSEVTYYIWISKDGVNFNNPITVTSW